jgi:hypothetical protein
MEINTSLPQKTRDFLLVEEVLDIKVVFSMQSLVLSKRNLKVYPIKNILDDTNYCFESYIKSLISTQAEA